MFWNRKPAETPLNSAEYEKLSNLLIDLNNKIALLKGDVTGVMFDLEKLKGKLNQRNTKTPENPSESSVFSGLPTTQSKGLNSINPFL
jgi:hypothetical protein